MLTASAYWPSPKPDKSVTRNANLGGDRSNSPSAGVRCGGIRDIPESDCVHVGAFAEERCLPWPIHYSGIESMQSCYRC